MAVEDYEVRGSARRTRTMTAFREAGKLVVVVPDHMTPGQRREMVPGLVARFLAKEQRARPPRTDDELTARGVELYRTYIGPYSAGPEPVMGVRWVSNMVHRWGSCTIGTGEIRLSDRLQAMPTWVVDHVLLHEVAHLEEREHNERFWRLVNANPESSRARGFLEGVDFARHQAT